MTANISNIWGEIISIVASGVILLIFCVFFTSFTSDRQTTPGSSGRRKTQQEQAGYDKGEDDKGSEEVQADGYIDSFAGEIEESGGGPPMLVKIALIGIPLWWLLYLLLNWSQAFISMRTFGR
jgi:hypothetical protein